MEETKSESMYFIHSGEVSISKKGAAFGHLETGSYFGEMISDHWPSEPHAVGHV